MSAGRMSIATGRILGLPMSEGGVASRVPLVWNRLMQGVRTLGVLRGADRG